MLVPLVHRMLPPGKAVGIMTVDASSLRPEHFTGAGITKDIRTVVAGMETEKEFTRVLLDDQLELDVEVTRQEHLTVARRMLEAHPEVGAIVLECTNMPPYRADIQTATGLPVFDITTLVRMVHDAVSHGLPPRPA
jgi:Asp/Glu/hydantoin racemase